MQDLLQDLKQKAAAYAADEENNSEIYKLYDRAAQALYDAIATVVNAGKTVVLEGDGYFSKRQVIKTMGKVYHTDWLKFSSTRHDKYAVESCCMTSAETIEVIDIEAQILTELSQEDCESLGNSDWWKQITVQRAAFLQLHQPKACMPLDLFYDYLEVLLGRTVYTEDFFNGGVAKLKQESYTRGNCFPDIADLIAAHKQSSVTINKT